MTRRAASWLLVMVVAVSALVVAAVDEGEPKTNADRASSLAKDFACPVCQGQSIAESDVLLDKPRFGSFHGTDLELVLRARGIDTVIVTGIATNICCETTAREANVRDFRVFFLTDGTATFGIGDLTAEDIQAATCATLGFAFAQLATVGEMIGRLEHAATTSAAAE